MVGQASWICQELAGLPLVLMDWVPEGVMPALAFASETSPALSVYGGGGPPLPCPLVGIAQVAKDTGVGQVVGGGGGGGSVLTVSVSVA